jgi:hypothetical protein
MSREWQTSCGPNKCCSLVEVSRKEERLKTCSKMERRNPGYSGRERRVRRTVDGKGDWKSVYVSDVKTDTYV